MKIIAALVLAVLTVGNVAYAQDENPPQPPKHTPDNEVALFNGHDFSGWTFCMKNHADPAQTWSVTNGVIHCTGKPTGYIRTTEIYSNYFLTVEWRFVKVTPKADNTGILLHIQPPDKVWPQCVQVQGRHGRQGDIFLMEGAKAKEHKGMSQNTPVAMRGPSVENPIGQWNKAEIICLHHNVDVFINNKFVNEITDCSLNSGYIGFQSEGADIEIRAVVFSPLKF